MPETIPQIRPSFNRSLRLETRPELLSADTGALVQRELMDRSGLIDWLTERLHDPRHPSSIRYPLSDLLRTRLLLLGQGWRDQSDADRLRQDPSLRVASQTRRGTAALEEGQGLASQPTLSRLLDTLRASRQIAEDDVLDPRLVMPPPGSQGILGRGGGQTRVSGVGHEGREGQHPESGGRPPQHLAPGECGWEWRRWGGRERRHRRSGYNR